MDMRKYLVRRVTGGRHGRSTARKARSGTLRARAAVPQLEQYVPRRDDIRVKR